MAPRALSALLSVALLAAAACGESRLPPEPPPERPLRTPEQAVASVTVNDVRYWVEAFAHDSMAGRPTPSAELDAAAGTIAAGFRLVGLHPAFGDSFIQRWPTAFRYGVPTAYAPNVGGVVEGSDSRLRSEYLVVAASLDYRGHVRDGLYCVPVEADSLCNGAGAASGVAAVVELAVAFAGLNPGPKRSVLFLIFSGMQRSLFGSRYYAEAPTVALERIAGVIAMGPVGRGLPGQVFALEVAASTMWDRAALVQAAHPEEGILLDAASSDIAFDHLAFTERGIPALAFFNGPYPEMRRASDETELIDFVKATRVTRLAFWLGLDIANHEARPEWK